MQIIAPEKCDNFPTFILYHHNRRIGHAYLSLSGSTAKLADIYILNKKFPLPFFPFIRVRRNFRNRGYGTLLLKRIVEFCREHGIQQIYGQIVGDRPKLVSWYHRNGFTITDETTITMDLTP